MLCCWPPPRAGFASACGRCRSSSRCSPAVGHSDIEERHHQSARATFHRVRPRGVQAVGGIRLSIGCPFLGLTNRGPLPCRQLGETGLVMIAVNSSLFDPSHHFRHEVCFFRCGPVGLRDPGPVSHLWITQIRMMDARVAGNPQVPALISGSSDLLSPLITGGIRFVL